MMKRISRIRVPANQGWWNQPHGCTTRVRIRAIRDRNPLWESLDARDCLRSIFDYFPARLYVIDQDYRLLTLNNSRAQGRSSGEMIGKKCYQALFNRDTPCPKCLVYQTLSEGQATRRYERRQEAGGPGESADKEHPANKKHPKDSLDWEISSYPILNFEASLQSNLAVPRQSGRSPGHAPAIQAILLEQDVTEKRRLEEVLTQSEKLAAVGQLAAGIAHEINNPLTAIIANAQILQRELPPNSEMQVSVDLIARAGARAAQVMRNLLDFARKDEYFLGLTDVNETIERAVELVQHEIGARAVHLSLDLDPGLPAILASADHLQSVWLNLLMNAIDSLDKLPATIQVASLQIGNDLHISVADNGKGILPEDLSRIFEPFYTTKAPGRGTGLGLSVSYRIIQQHGGLFRVESKPSEGSTFFVVLPALY